MDFESIKTSVHFSLLTYKCHKMYHMSLSSSNREKKKTHFLNFNWMWNVSMKYEPMGSFLSDKNHVLTTCNSISTIFFLPFLTSNMAITYKFHSWLTKTVAGSKIKKKTSVHLVIYLFPCHRDILEFFFSILKKIFVKKRNFFFLNKKNDGIFHYASNYALIKHSTLSMEKIK